MRRITTIILIISLALLGTMGCAKNSENTETEETTSTEVTESVSSSATTESETDTAEDIAKDTADKKVLVIYFSATGTTKKIAEKIASIEKADLYEIVPKEPYSDEDLDYNDDNSRATKEQNDPNVRPEYEDIDLDIENDYSTIFLGYPIWWGQEPRIMDTFVESYNFDGITIIPFCTSGSSSIDTSSNNLATKAGTGNWLAGNIFSGSSSDDEIEDWIAELGLK